MKIKEKSEIVTKKVGMELVSNGCFTGIALVFDRPSVLQ